MLTLKSPEKCLPPHHLALQMLGGREGGARGGRDGSCRGGGRSARHPPPAVHATLPLQCMPPSPCSACHPPPAVHATLPLQCMPPSPCSACHPPPAVHATLPLQCMPPSPCSACHPPPAVHATLPLQCMPPSPCSACHPPPAARATLPLQRVPPSPCVPHSFPACHPPFLHCTPRLVPGYLVHGLGLLPCLCLPPLLLLLHCCMALTGVGRTGYEEDLRHVRRRG
ncbi:unnamed protein product [Closterium sp. Naga37s-1]|nr:unnamed protein product [Closterium sp. Naga37s-1]